MDLSKIKVEPPKELRIGEIVKVEDDHYWIKLGENGPVFYPMPEDRMSVLEKRMKELEIMFARHIMKD